MIKKAIVYVFYDYLNNKCLVETRTNKQTMSGKMLFPGGKVNDDEKDNLTKTLLREINEELGVSVNEFKDLKVAIKGVNDFTLYPYLITSWTGIIPDRILDKGSMLEWVQLSKFNPDLKPVKDILKIVKDIVAHY